MKECRWRWGSPVALGVKLPGLDVCTENAGGAAGGLVRGAEVNVGALIGAVGGQGLSWGLLVGAEGVIGGLGSVLASLWGCFEAGSQAGGCYGAFG